MEYYKVGNLLPELDKYLDYGIFTKARAKGQIRLGLQIDSENYWSNLKKEQDIALFWCIIGKHEDFPEQDAVLDRGVALVRKGKVHFYDRSPRCGIAMKIKKSPNAEFRERGNLIAKNIESLLKSA